MTFLLPEVYLFITFLGLVLSEIGYFGERRRLIFPLAIFGLLIALIQTVLGLIVNYELVFQEHLIIDGLSYFFKIIFLILGLLVVILHWLSDEIPEDRSNEFNIFVIGSVLGMGVIAEAAKLSLIFVGILFVTLLGCFLSASSKNQERAIESSIKFNILSFASFGLFVMAGGILFSKTGSMDLVEI